MKPEQIKRLREKLQMTQEEFAKHLGLATRSAVCHLERGSKEPKGPLLVLLQLMEENLREQAKRDSKNQRSRPG